MVDFLNKKERSRLMSLIRGKNTKPEKIVFRYLRSQNIYFKKHYSRAAGTPDIAVPSKKIAVFIDGDFWHGRDYENLLRKYDADSFWPKKIARNIRRDSEQRNELIKNGWKVLSVWESELKKATREITLEKIANFIKE